MGPPLHTYNWVIAHMGDLCLQVSEKKWPKSPTLNHINGLLWSAPNLNHGTTIWLSQDPDTKFVFQELGAKLYTFCKRLSCYYTLGESFTVAI